MAFGFFKKNDAADTIFTGGRIYTQNPDFPWVEAVACKDGIIMDVGDFEDLQELEGKHTKIVDLEGGVMLPGYIDTCGRPALDTLKNVCLFLKDGTLEDNLSQISKYASEKEDVSVIFAYGYKENIVAGMEPEEIRSMLDQICGDRPVIVLGKSGMGCLINTAALELVKAAAEEDEVENITLPYLFGVLDPIGLDTLSEAAINKMAGYCERGFTAVFDWGAPEYFSSIYLNLLIHFYQENILKQRYFGSLLITRNVNPKAVMQKLSQYRTNCVELNGHINFQTLKLSLEETKDTLEGASDELNISGDLLKELCVEAGDKGFNVHVDASGDDAVSAAACALGAIRSAGYRKNALTLVHGPVSDSKELSDTCYSLGITEALSTIGFENDEWKCIENAVTASEAVDLLTRDAAELLGSGSGYGSIEKGSRADFVIFKENPLEATSLEAFKKLKAARTVIDGVIVYDVESDDPSTWHSSLNYEEEE